MKKIVMLAAVTAALATQFAVAQEAQSPWQVRVRAVRLDMANKSDPIGVLGVPADQISVNNKTIPEVDISYFFTPNIAAELILTYPQKQDVSLSGSQIGTFKHLPPSLTLQYHFTPDSVFSPYVGAGVNYTRISSVDLLGGTGDLDSHSFGGVLQAGFDIKIDKHWLVNLDVKKVQIGSDVYVNGLGKVSSVKLDPWLFGVGVGYRF